MPAEVPLRASGLLDVGGGHSIYWEESGCSHGIPALYLHGGPGGTLGQGGYRRAFDPDRVRIIGLDQRGCGRSHPHVTAPGYDLSGNTTATLIGDIERLREHLEQDGHGGPGMVEARREANERHVQRLEASRAEGGDSRG